MIQAHDCPKNLVALAADLPSMAPRHLHDQASHVQSLEHPTDRMALRRCSLASSFDPYKASRISALRKPRSRKER